MRRKEEGGKERINVLNDEIEKILFHKKLFFIYFFFLRLILHSP